MHHEGIYKKKNIYTQWLQPFEPMENGVERLNQFVIPICHLPDTRQHQICALAAGATVVRYLDAHGAQRIETTQHRPRNVFVCRHDNGLVGQRNVLHHEQLGPEICCNSRENSARIGGYSQ